MRFAAAQSAALAIQRQVAKPDVVQETQPRADFLDDIRRDLLPKFRQAAGQKKSSAFSTDKPQTSMMESPGSLIFRPLELELRRKPVAAKGHRQDFRLEPFPAAGVAELRSHVGLEPVADEFASLSVASRSRSGSTLANGG